MTTVKQLMAKIGKSEIFRAIMLIVVTPVFVLWSIAVGVFNSALACYQEFHGEMATMYRTLTYTYKSTFGKKAEPVVRDPQEDWSDL